MHDRSRHPTRVASHGTPRPAQRTGAVAARAPRTTAGLLVCLATPLALGLLVAVLTAPAAVVAGLLGILVGGAGTLLTVARHSGDAPEGQTAPG